MTYSKDTHLVKTINDLQERYNLLLPKEYIDFLRKDIGSKYTHCEYKQLFSIITFYNFEANNNLELNIKAYSDRLPKGVIPIASTSGGNLLCMNLLKDNSSEILFWDHENVPEDVIGVNDLQYLEKTLSDFLINLETPKNFSLEEEGYNVKEVWVDPSFLDKINKKK